MNKESKKDIFLTETAIIPEQLEVFLDEMPASEIVAATNPSSLGMDRILAGIGLTTITINAAALTYILPSIGRILLVLGFRNLHKENKWFHVAYICSILLIFLTIPDLFLNATIYADWLQGIRRTALQYVFYVIQLSMLFCLYKAIECVQKKGGIKEKSRSALALFLLDAYFPIAVALGLNQGVPALLTIFVFIAILINLSKISALMATNGYLIEAAPVKISDPAFGSSIAAALAGAVACGYLFFSSYPMEWAAIDFPDYAGNETYERLIELGYPQSQLNDLPVEELELLKGADYVFAVMDNAALNKGKEKIQYGTYGQTTTITYPVKELTMNNIAVHIAEPGDAEGSWRIYHHFSLLDSLKAKGTSALQLWPLDSMHSLWSGTQNLQGKLFCKQGEKDMSADYSVSQRQVPIGSIFSYNQDYVTEYYFSFSLPKRATARRGYVAYTSKILKPGSILDARMNYVHQVNLFDYPLTKAVDHAQNSGLLTLTNSNHNFITIYGGVQFYVENGKPYVSVMPDPPTDQSD